MRLRALAPRAAIPAGLFLSALAIRLVGIDFGLPHMYQWDEYFLAAPISRFVSSGDILPHFYSYPTGYIYWQFGFVPLSVLIFVLKHGLASANSMALSDFLLVGRSVTAFIGAGAVSLTYYFAVRFWNDRVAGFIGGAVLALSPLHVAGSRWLTTDVPMAAAAFLGAFLLFLYLERRDWRTLCAAAIVFGTAVSIKYNGAFFAGAALIVIAARTRDWTKVVGFGSIAALAFVALTPGIIFENQLFLRDTFWEARHYFAAGDATSRFGLPLRRFLDSSWSYALTPGPTILAAAGVFILAFRQRLGAFTFFVLPASYLLFLASIKVTHVRNLQPLLPYGALLAGLAGACLIKSLRRRAKPSAYYIALVLLAALFWLRPVVITARETGLLLREDNRTIAKKWFEDNVPWPQRIAKAASNYVPLDKGGQIETPPINPDKYEIHAGPYLLTNNATEYAAGGFTYLITQDLAREHSELVERYPRRAEELRSNYESITGNSKLVLRLESPGYGFNPAVAIYRLDDDVLRRFNAPRRTLIFDKKWVRSEAAPARTMPTIDGGYLLKAPARAATFFTAPAKDFVLEVQLKVLQGYPEVALEVDGAAVAKRKIRGEEVVKTPRLSAPPYFRHLAVRCLGPEGVSFELKYVTVERAQ
ncbi:MAG: phospholipid carrier-dependent glycosyltransferase [candidate division Zixibacteria bacterium]|nr:phospholipid carrier-dependent glycosyltransferase [candidate division Zixibacteria bacterium]